MCLLQIKISCISSRSLTSNTYLDLLPAINFQHFTVCADSVYIIVARYFDFFWSY
jgi:hypothetical protein